MKGRYVALLACALLICSAGAIACKNSGGGTKPRSTAGPTSGVTPLGTASAALKDYFDKAQQLDATATQRLATASAPLDATATASNEQKLQVIRDFIAAQTAVDRDLRDGMKQLTPPPEASDAHKRTVDALDSFISYSEQLTTGAATATDLVDIAALLRTSQAEEANRSLADACAGLVNTAASYGITVTLDCGQG